jgi:tetratricopeptide (TPR) repeat protein
VYRDKGEFDKALEFFDKYRTTSRMMGYKLGDGYARAGLGNVYQELGKYSEAKRLYEEAEGIIGEIGDKVLLANIYAYQAELKIGLQDFASGRKLAKKALALAREAKVQAQEIPALRALGKATFAKDQKQGLHYLKQSVSLARTQMMQYELAVSLYEMAYALAKHGMKDEARMHIQEAKEILKRAGAKYWMGKIKELEEGIL